MTRSQPRYIETVHRRGYRFVRLGRDPRQRASPPAAAAARRVSLHPGPGRRLPPRAVHLRGTRRRAGAAPAGFEVATRGHRQTVFVAGEPGIGKTRPDRRLSWPNCAGGSRSGWGEASASSSTAAASRTCHSSRYWVTSVGGPGGAEVVATLRQHAPSWLAQLPALLPWAERDALRRQVEGLSGRRRASPGSGTGKAGAPRRAIPWSWSHAGSPRPRHRRPQGGPAAGRDPGLNGTSGPAPPERCADFLEIAPRARGREPGQESDRRLGRSGDLAGRAPALSGSSRSRRPPAPRPSTIHNAPWPWSSSGRPPMPIT